MNTRKGNKFEISDGNLKVLETIPLMMKDKNYRTKLRRLTLNFLTDSNANNPKKSSFWMRDKWGLIKEGEIEK